MYNRKIVFDGVKKYVGSLDSAQVKSVDSIIDAAEKYDVPSKHLAYILATAWFEARLRPVRETFASSQAQMVRRLNKAYPRKVGTNKQYWKIDKNGNSFGGRSLVQLTWDYNYKKMGKYIGIDLYSYPEKALEHSIAGEIIVAGMIKGMFTGKKLSDYKTYYSMRRTVNGTDKAKKFAVLADNLDNFTAVAYEDAPAPTPPAVPWEPPVYVPEPSFGVAVNVKGVKVVYDDGAEVMLSMPTEAQSKAQSLTSSEVSDFAQAAQEEFGEYKHATRSKSIWGTVLGVTVLVGPLVARMLGYDITEETITSLGQNGAQILQLLAGLAAAVTAIKGRHDAKDKLYWVKKPT